MPQGELLIMSRGHVDALIFHLPDIAILTMVAVIAIGLPLIGTASLVGWIILPMAAFLGLLWFKEYLEGKKKPVRGKTKKEDDG